MFFIAFCFLFLNPVKAGGVHVVVDFDLQKKKKTDLCDQLA
jgi:hypothetical protein